MRTNQTYRKFWSIVLGVTGSCSGLLGLIIFAAGGTQIRIASLGLSLRDFKNPLIIFFLSTTGAMLLYPEWRTLFARLPLGGRARRLRTLLPTTLLVGSILVCLNSLLSSPLALDSDALGHYAYLRSLVIDGDLDFANEFTFYDPTKSLPDPDPTGRVPNPWPIGLGILWVPFFAIAHTLALLSSLTADPWPASGYSPPYHVLAVLGSLLYGVVGVVLMYRVVRLSLDERRATAAVFAAIWGTPVAFYFLHQPGMAHVPSVLTVSAFILLWLRRRPILDVRWGFACGALAGAATLVRYQDGVILLIPLIDAVLQARGRWRSASTALLGICCGLVSVLAPQVAVNRYLYGSWLLVPQGEGFMKWTEPAIFEVLFSTRHGLLSWTPIWGLGILGLCAYTYRRFETGLPLLVFLLAEIYVAAAATDWWAGASFGNRRLASATTIVAIGLGQVLASMGDRWSRTAIVIGSGFIAWNCWLIYLFWNGLIPHEDAIAFREVLALAGQYALWYLEQVTSPRALLFSRIGKEVVLVISAGVFLAAVSRSRRGAG